jgi:hypothetical protein
MATQESPSSPRNGRGRWFALVILCTAALMIILDGTIVT